MFWNVIGAIFGFVLGAAIVVGIVVGVINMAGDPRNQWW